MISSVKSILFLILISICIQGHAEPLRTVSFVDVNKYLGVWYQIAHRPLIFEGLKPCSCARQVLTANSDGTVAVYNSFYRDWETK